MTQAPHTVFLSYDGMTDPLGQSQVIPYLEGLAAAGYAVSRISFEKQEAFARLESAVRERLRAASIHWIPLSYTKSPPVFSTVYDMLRMQRALSALHRQRPLALLHARSYISARIALRFARQHKLPWVFDMRGFYADERVDGGLWPQNKLLFRSIYRYFKRAEKRFLAESQAVISLTEAGKRIIESELAPGLAPDKTRVIPCCADLTRFDYRRFSPQERQAVRAELGIGEGQLAVVYSGSVGTWYMLPEMLQWFARLRAHRSDAVFLFLSADRERISREAALQGVPSEALVIRQVPYEQMPRMLSAADLGLFFIVPTFSKQASSPTKMGELMGMGLPLVCNTGVGDVASIVEQSGCGLALDVTDAAQLDSSARRAEELLSLDKEPIRQAAGRFYSLQSGVATYCRVYDETLADSQHKISSD